MSMIFFTLFGSVGVGSREDEERIAEANVGKY